MTQPIQSPPNLGTFEFHPEHCKEYYVDSRYDAKNTSDDPKNTSEDPRQSRVCIHNNLPHQSCAKKKEIDKLFKDEEQDGMLYYLK